MATINPRKWRYTYESQSHIPILKLFLFSPNFNPIIHCDNLSINLIFEKSVVELSWNSQNLPNLVKIIVPLPRVLVDLDSPLNFRAHDDHIEVKIPLLLPVDHPIVSSFISDLSSGDDFERFDAEDEFLTPLSMDSDFKDLSCKGDVEVCCRSCGFKLTKHSVRCLVDLPSVNWTDVADNWFGSCCCSFGSISEKLVNKYVKLYRCTEGSCLLTSASLILCKDDITGFEATLAELHIGKCDDIPVDNDSCESDHNAGTDVPCSTESSVSHDPSTIQGSMRFQSEEHSVSGACKVPDELHDHDQKPSHTSTGVDFAKDEHHCCARDAVKSLPEDQELNGSVDLQEEQKSFLNCYLGNAFLFGPSGLSKDIGWIDFSCPQCSHILGAYPCTDGSEPLDGGVRLLKCYISISTPPDIQDELFRKYTLERMFTCQLLESAKDELSFRTVVKDLNTKCSMLNMILVNPNSWCCSGCCSEDSLEKFVKIYLHPVVKVLFSHCSSNNKSELSANQEWESKHQANEVFMLKDVIRELMESIDRAKDSFPPSFSSAQGFHLSSIPR
ncbi:hypothetical protein RND81_13G183000 [Saponaria officinalis]|uniref:Ubiquitin-conjugating enzyme E2-binding protein n=1 Tax=Saponaria officinalis TaxID=3572 RepID=A0AAW1H2E8_SAPOF